MGDRSNKHHFHRSDFFLLLACVTIGICLRWFNLDAKSPASIEIASLGFSLGNSFLHIPIERLISIPEILSPLKFDPIATPNNTLQHLMSESTHPPLYFILNHFWLKLHSPQNELDLLHAGRSLSSIFGVAAIPAIFALGYLVSSSLLVGHLAAASIAVSPYGIYLSQEARHYTLTVLWIIASLCCLIVAVKSLKTRSPLPIWIVCIWVVVNSLGIATHYFFSLTLCAEGLVIVGFWLRNAIENKRSLAFSSSELRILAAGIGTLIGCLVWLPYAKTVSGNEITEWITTSLDFQDLWEPIVRMMGWLLSMIFLLPVEGVNLSIAIASGLILVGVLFWVMPVIIKGFRSPEKTLVLELNVLKSFFLAAIALFLIVIYLLRRDLSLAARYHFVYFPAVIVLLASALGRKTEDLSSTSEGRGFSKSEVMRHKSEVFLTSYFQTRRQKAIAAILVMGLLGSLTVVSNYGFQKSKRADILVDRIENTSKVPVLIATTYKTHSEIRELMAIAFEFKRLDKNLIQSPQFILARRNTTHPDRLSSSFSQILDRNTRPFDLWTTNLQAKTEEIQALNCHQDPQKIKIKGYKTRLYHCDRHRI
jgi:uncharacterized membrane protein